MADEITDAILEDAQGPLEAETDAGRIRQRSLDELIKADKYLKGIASTGGAWGRCRRERVVPPGTTGPLSTE